MDFRLLNSNADLVKSQDSVIIRDTLRVYGSIYLVCFFSFIYLRKRYPRLFNIRSWVHEEHCELAEKEYTCLSWIWEVFQPSDEEIMLQCGLDALCFLRALRFGRRLAFAGCFHAIWLIPVYVTAENSSSTSYLNDPFVVASVSHLPSSSPRFIAPVLAAYLIFVHAMVLIYYEVEWFTRWRHKFLQLRKPSNYTVYVSGIPKRYKTNAKLAEYFKKCTSESAVVEAHVTMQLPNLDAKVARREVVVRKLEHIAAVEQQTGNKMTQHSIHIGRGLEKVESSKLYEDELRILNRDIARAIHEIMAREDPRRGRLCRSDGSKDLLSAVDIESSTNASANGILEQEPEEVVLAIPFLEKDTSDIRTEMLVSEDDDICTGDHDDEPTEVKRHGLDRDELAGTLPDIEDHEQTFRDDGMIEYPRVTHVDVQSPAMLISALETGELDQHSTSEAMDSSGSSMDISSKSRAKRSKVRMSIESGSKVVVGSIGSAGHSIVKSSRVAGQTIAKGSRAAGYTIVKGSAVAGYSLAHGSRVAGEKIKNIAKEVNVDNLVQVAGKATELGTHLVSSAGAVVPMLVPRTEGDYLSAGFVVFRTLYATQVALQMIHHSKSDKMNTREAPEPDDIFWRNVGLGHSAQRTGRLVALAAATIICFFWSIPMAFLSSLTQLSSLEESVPKLGNFLSTHPAMKKFFAQLAPLVVLIMNETLLPALLKGVAAWEGHVSAALLEASLFFKMGTFMIIQTFFVSAISGSIASEITNLLNHPEDIITLLANSLPAQSSYFIQIILAQTFLLQAFELLRIYPLGLALLRRFVGPRATPQERRRAWGWIKSLEEPPPFWIAETLALLVLYYMVFFVYAPITPITCCFLLVCFFMLECGYRYQFIHNYPRKFDTGGRLWMYFIQFVLASMIISQLTLIGLLALKQSKFAGPAVGPLMALTIMFIIHINSRHSHIANFLPTFMAMNTDEESVADQLNPDFAAGLYIQPALQKKRVDPNYDFN